jgi:hypothetical protein
MGRFVLAIVLAPVFWGALQFPGQVLLSAIFPDSAGNPAGSPGYLILALVFAFGYAFVSGYCAAWVAAAEPRRIGIGAGLCLLAVGIAVQVSFWEAVPLWWHLTFLASIVPLTMIGAAVKGSPAQEQDP